MQWTWSLKTCQSSEAENIPRELMCEEGKTGYLLEVCSTHGGQDAFQPEALTEHGVDLSASMWEPEKRQ